MQVQSVAEQLDVIQIAARESVTVPRDLGVLKVGQWCRHGDLQIQRVADNHLRGEEVVIPSDGIQIAFGNTLGSRHIASGAWRAYTPANAGEFTGMVLVAVAQPDGHQAIIHHPTHATCISPPDRTYQVTFQEDIRSGRKVSD